MAEDSQITYEKLYDLLRQEQTEASLQKLPNSFFTDLLQYLRTKQRRLEKAKETDNVFGSSQYDEIRLQLKNISKLITDLYERREKKIVQLALNKSRTKSRNIDTSNLLVEENSLLLSLTNLLDEYREQIPHQLLALRMPFEDKPEALNVKQYKEVEQKEDEYPTVEPSKEYVVLDDIPEFLGPDMKMYGPYGKDEKVEIPDQVASVLKAQQKIKANH